MCIDLDLCLSNVVDRSVASRADALIWSTCGHNVQVTALCVGRTCELICQTLVKVYAHVSETGIV
jgi:hypothetical protein